MPDAIVGGIVGGLVSPLLLSILKHFVIWRTEAKLELKRRIFDEAVSALAARAVDALDPELQANKKGDGEFVRETEYRPETLEAMERSRSQVTALFGPDTANLFERAVSCKVSWKSVPNTEFEDARTAAVASMAQELGISAPRWLGALISRWSGTRRLVVIRHRMSVRFDIRFILLIELHNVHKN